MAYVAPPTFVAADPLAAADLNILGADIAYLKAIADGLNFSGVKVTRTAATSISDSTLTAVTWTAETWDYGSWWSSGTNVIVPAGAIPSGFTTIACLVKGRALFAANATGYRSFQILQNGSSIMTPTTPGFSGASLQVSDFDIITVAAGDTLALSVYQNSTGALNASGMGLTVIRLFPVA